MHHFVDPSTVCPCSMMWCKMWHYFQPHHHHHQIHSTIYTNAGYNEMLIDCLSCVAGGDSWKSGDGEREREKKRAHAFIIIGNFQNETIFPIAKWAYMLFAMITHCGWMGLLLMANVRLWSRPLWTLFLSMLVLVFFVFRPSTIPKMNLIIITEFFFNKYWLILLRSSVFHLHAGGNNCKSIDLT